MNTAEFWGVFLEYFLVPFVVFCLALALIEFIDERRHGSR